MKNIYKILLSLVLLLSVNKSNAQMTCLAPTLGVFDNTTGAPMSNTISCSYANLLDIYPNPFAVGNAGTTPCMRIIIGLTNANAATNNSIAIGQGTNVPIISMCSATPAPCFTAIPNSSSYTMSLFFLDPSQSHGYNLCNTNVAANMSYTVCSCYNNVPITSGVWNNGIAGGCQTITIPANTPIGLVGYTVSPAVVSTASFNANQGDLFLDTYQMSQGIYTITYSFTSQNGCSATATKTISITNPYVSSWTATGPLCANGACVSPGSITGTAGGTFTASAGMSGGNFCPALVGAGSWPVTYTVGVTPQCGNFTNNNITVNPVPIANAGATQSLTCSNTTTILAGSGGGTYLWSGPGIVSGGTTANPVVGTSGVYSLIVTSGGCSSAASTVAVGFNTVAPPATAGTSGAITCTTNTINLTSNPNLMTYTWTAPGGSSISGGVNNQNTTGTGPGTYTVTIKDPANGCSATAVVAASVNTVAPVTSAATTGSITCSNLSINLTSTLSGVNYTWTAPAGSSITGGVNIQNTTGSGPGTYTVKVQSAVNGCTAQATVAALINQTITPVTASTSGSITCTNSTSISFTATPASGVTYTWTAPGTGAITSGANSQISTGSGPGTYTVRITDAVNGCTNIATVAAIINTTAPVGVTASSSVAITCLTNTINLNGLPAGGNYTWTAPGTGAITGGANNQNTTGQGAGTYTLVYQSAVNGCTASAVVAASVNTTIPTGQAATSSGTVTCLSLAINLSASATTGGPFTYSWTAPAGSSITSGATSSSATGSGGGTYSVVITGANGCSAALATTVAPTTNTTPPTPTINPAPLLTCSTTSVVLTSTTTGVLYNWSGPGIITSINQATVGVVLVGTYSLVVQSAVNSCTAIATVVVSNNTIAPTALGSGSVNITCATPSVSLIGSANPSSCTVVWTGGVCAGATSFTATACSPGTYFMTVTNPANGCSSAPASFTVASNSNFPIATLANTATITCLITSAQVVATTTASPVTFTWSGPGIVSGSTTPTITVNMGGVYTLTLTNTLNGCSSVITNSVTNDNAAVTPTAIASNTITCSSSTATMTAGAGVGTYSYTWSGPGIVGTNTLSTATSSLGGTYNVTVTNTTNGCVGTVALTVGSSTNAPTAVSVNPPTFTLSCTTSTTALTATAVGASTYSWTASGPGVVTSGGTSSTATVSGNGTYSVVVTGTNGCSAAAAVAAVSPNTLAPTYVLSNSSPSITCLTANPTISVNITSTVGIGSYSWSPASGISGSTSGSTVTFTNAGTYTCVITATNGCTTPAIVTVTSATATPMFVVGTATASNLSCANSTVNINPAYTPSTNITYSWSGPGIVGSTTNSSVSVNANGQYSVTVTNTLTGCSSTSLTVDVFGTTTPPTLGITSSSSVGIGCSPTTSTNILNANALPVAVNYTWSNSANTPTILVTTAGIYSVVIVDPVTSCSATAQYTVLNNSTLPNATAGANVVMPCGGPTTTVTLNGNSTTAGVTFTWTGPGVVSGASTATAIANAAGVYTLSVSDPTTGCIATSTVLVINGVPTASFTPDVTTGFAPQVAVFTNASTGAILYNWSFGNGSTSTATNTSTTFTASGTYSVMLIASSGLCSDTAYAVIVIQDGFSLEIPNVFTPNDDGINDFFTIKSTGVKEISLQIFNRWGQLMYEFTGAKAAWDGITNNGQKATDGTYFYFIVATGYDTTKEPVKKNGPVTLFR